MQFGLHFSVSIQNNLTMAQQVIPRYHCAQKDLYSVCRSGWTNYENHLADFTAHKALYDAAKKTAALAAITAAEDLPDEQARGASSELLRLEVVSTGNTVLSNFKKLKSYINSAYPKAQWKALYEAAGQTYYEAAANEDWESLRQIGISMGNFIDAHVVELTAGDNMPATFQTQSETDTTTFNTKYNDFKEAAETGEATAGKLTANNAIFDELTLMFADAQVIYEDDFDASQLFVFDRLLQQVNPSNAGLQGQVFDGGTFTPLGDATVTMQKSGSSPVSTTTDQFGAFNITGIPAGDYTVTLTKSGYQTINDVVTIQTGTVSSKEYVMQPVAVVSISGVVTNQATSALLSGIDVELAPDGLVANSSGVGQYSFGAIPTGTKTISVNDGAYQPFEAEVEYAGASVVVDIELVPV